MTRCPKGGQAVAAQDWRPPRRPRSADIGGGAAVGGIMPVPSRDSAQVLPSLSDYGRALWRHRAIVGIALLVGTLAGVVVLPHLASKPEYQVTQRVDVKSLTAERLFGAQSPLVQSKSKPVAGTTQTQATPLDPSLVPDITALESVLNRPGNQFGRLEVLQGVKRSLWLGTVAQSLVALSVPGTTQIDVSVTDPDPELAADLVGSYVVAYADHRNDADALLTRQAMAKLRRSTRPSPTCPPWPTRSTW